MADMFIRALQRRRSVYALAPTIPISETSLCNIVASCAKYCPSAFNIPTSRVVILFGSEHKRYWETVLKAIEGRLWGGKGGGEGGGGGGAGEELRGRLASFAAGAGTVVFYEDGGAVRGVEEALPEHAWGIKTWGEEGNAMLQYAVWTALSQEGVRGSLQHYVGGKVDEAVGEVWGISREWRTMAQLPFGEEGEGSEVGAKEYAGEEGRVRVEGGGARR
jgi:predicted oxidoreductase (fatty acid repression mutant protein)